jgi:methionine-gamma-lyase
VSDRLLRLSVGLEDVEDLWADLERALGTERSAGEWRRKEVAGR